MKVMEKVIRKVTEIDQSDRRAIEHLIGQNLAEHQQVIISVVNLDRTNGDDSSAVAASGGVATWWNIYEGLSEEDIDRLEQVIRRRAILTRAVE